MATTERYTTVIELNSEQAKRNLDELRRKVESWKSDLAEAREKKMGRSFIAAIRKELKDAEKELKKYDSEVARTIDTMNNLQSASVDRIEDAQKNLKRLASEVPHDSPFFQQLNDQLDMVTQELENIKATKAFEQLQQEAAGATKSAEQLQAELNFISQTADNAQTASVRQLQLAEKTAQNIKESSQKGSSEWNEANARLEQIRNRLNAIEQEERKVVTVIDRYNSELEQAGKMAEQVKSETELVDRTLGKLNTASVRDIEYSIKILNEEIRNTERSGGDVEKLTERLKLLNTELKKVQDMQKPDEKKGNIFSRSMNFLNKNWGAITQVIGAYSGIRDVVKGSVEAFAQMDQEMNNVRKYTGQNIEEVKRMNETFKQMDTRTPREQLNQLAGSAGRLGITATPAVLEFVDAADKINVALGDDLGKGAVDAIGKLAMAFGEDEERGLREAMLSTGSAVNELAQNSAAGAGYLVDFAARLSGVGVQAGLTQAEILGLGAAMDENMQKDEMAATALSQIITKMTTDSKTFARIAGKNVEEFAQLVKTDMNQALMQFFEAMNRKGGFTELAPLFNQMGLDGTRAIGVLSTLSSKIDDVRRHQQLATEAYEKGTSVLDEFNVQNDTYQAKLEKARKAFNDLRVELGEKLLPVAHMAIGTTSLMVRVLETSIGFVMENWKVLTTLTAAVATYTVAVNMETISEKALTVRKAINNGLHKAGAVVKAADAAATVVLHTAIDVLTRKISLATAAQQLFNKAVRSHPYILAATAVATLVGVIVSFIGRTKEATKAQQMLNDATREAYRDTYHERTELEVLVETAKNKALADDTRREAIRELQEKYPDYLKNLTLENINTQNAAASIDNLVKSLLAEAKARALIQKIQKAEDEKEKIDEKYFEGVSGMWQSIVAYWQSETNKAADQLERGWNTLTHFLTHGDLKGWNYDTYITENGYALDEVTQKQQNYQKEVNETTGAISEMRKELRKTVAESGKLKAGTTNSSANTAEGSPVTTYKSEKELKKEETLRKKQEAERKKQLKQKAEAAKAEYQAEIAEEMLAYRTGLNTYIDYMDERHRITVNYYDAMKRIYGEDSTEYRKLLGNRESEEQEYFQWQQKQTQQQMVMQRLEREASLRKQFSTETNSAIYQNEEALNESLFELDMEYLRKKRDAYTPYTKEWIEADWQLQQEDRQHQFQLQQQWAERISRYREEVGRADYARLEKIETSGAERFYGALVVQGRMTRDEYDAILDHIRRKYMELRAAQTADNSVEAKAGKALETAKKAAGAEQPTSGDNAVTGIFSISQAVSRQKLINEQLKLLYGKDYENNREYQEAKRQLETETMQQIISGAQAAYSTISSLLSATTAYAQACSDAEVTRITANYDKQIEAAGSNSKKRTELEKQRDKEIAKAKTNANRKAMTIEMAQAVAQTAMGAISAYSSAMAGAPYPANLVLAPAAAGIALAAGAIQIATIKKQHENEAAGFYEGGFTGGRQYRKEAGVVHEGEFVANHQAVRNPNVLPFLNFIDQAQRNNTVGSLSMQDVSRSLGAGGATQVVTPIVNLQTDNEELIEAVNAHREATDRLVKRIDDGIPAYSVIDGPNGQYRMLKEYERLINKG